MQVDDEIETALDNVPFVDSPTADTLFEGQIWGWDGIDCRGVVAQNHNKHSFRNV